MQYLYLHGLRACRCARGDTQAQVSDRTGFAQATLSRYESLQRRASALAVVVLAQALDTTPEAVVGHEE